MRTTFKSKSTYLVFMQECGQANLSTISAEVLEQVEGKVMARKSVDNTGCFPAICKSESEKQTLHWWLEGLKTFFPHSTNWE